VFVGIPNLELQLTSFTYCRFYHRFDIFGSICPRPDTNNLFTTKLVFTHFILNMPGTSFDSF
jgi:hypothetical protein